MPTPEDNLKAPAQTAQKAAGAVKNVKQIIQTAKLVGAAGTGPVGWAVAAAPYLAKFQNQIKKVIAAAVGLGAYLLYMLWLKLLGMLAGLAFGAITGLPLLLIPGAGPFLYAGWTGFWTMRGIADPTGTINLATHPWEAITKPFGWIQGQFSGVGGGIESAESAVAQGTSTAASATGSFITGAGSAIWNGLTAAAGNSLGWVSAGLTKGISLLSTASSTVAGMASSAVGIALGATVTTAFAASVVTNSAHFSPEGDSLTSEFVAPPGDNQFFTITKIANPTTIPNNQLPANIAFTISLTAKDTRLTEIKISDQLSVQTQSGNFTVTQDIANNPISQPCNSTIPKELLPNDKWQCQITITATTTPSINLFNDSSVNNVVTVTATPDGGQPTTGSSSAQVAVGTPPSFCGNIQLVDNTAIWTNDEKSSIQQVCNTLAGSTINSLIGNAGTIQIIREGGSGCLGTTSANVITINGCNLSSVSVAKYVVIHELGHVIAYYNGNVYQAFLNSGAYEAEGLVPTYPFSPAQINWCAPQCESFAEMIADYVNSLTYNYPARTWGSPPYPGGPWNFSPPSSFTTFKNDMTIHYNFAKLNIFGGVEF